MDFIKAATLMGGKCKDFIYRFMWNEKLEKLKTVTHYKFKINCIFMNLCALYNFA